MSDAVGPEMISPPHVTQGAFYIGVAISRVLLGISCLQTFIYVTKCRSDRIYLKLLVFLVFTCDLLHQLMCEHSVYIMLISNYGRPEALSSIPWSLVGEVYLTGFLSLFVQSFYIRRIFYLSNKNWWLTTLAGIFVLPSFALYTTYTVKYAQFTHRSQLSEIKWIAKVVLSLNAVCDTLIAAIMVWLLQQSRLNHQPLNQMVNRLFILTIHSGLVTSVCATLTLILILTCPNTLIPVIPFFMTPRVYANSLLATLNARWTVSINATQSGPISIEFVNNTEHTKDSLRNCPSRSQRNYDSSTIHNDANSVTNDLEANGWHSKTLRRNTISIASMT